MTDGLRLATVFDRVEVDRSPVMDCARRLRPGRLPRLVENYLDEVSVVIDESTLPFHIWDALVAVCLGDAPRLGGDASFWVFVSLRHPITTSRPYLSQVACEAARRTRKLAETMGCHRRPVTATSRKPIVLRGSGGGE
jgi:hypothetical protein